MRCGNADNLWQAEFAAANEADHVNAFDFIEYMRGLPAISLALPEKYSRTIALMDCLLAFQTKESFIGGMLLIESTFTTNETVSSEIFCRLRAGGTSNTDLIDDSPGTTFSGSERDDLYYLFLFAILAKWDAVFIPKRRDFMYSVLHDGFLEIHASEPDSIAPVVEWLKGFGFLA